VARQESVPPHRDHAKIAGMIANLSLILLCQLAGEVIVRGVALPMPGPVVGLVLLLGLFGVFAGIAMSLNALVTSLVVPLAATLLVRAQ
jgi:putative effector of murein hydrolase LrgA (UPF0299 family)